MNLPSGVSTWTFNGLLGPELGAVLDGGAPYLSRHGPAVRRHAAELVSAILPSGIRYVELWYSRALHDEEILAELGRLSADGRISSMHAPFGPAMDLSSLDEEVRLNGLEACRLAAGLLSRLGGGTLVVHSGSQVEDAAEMQRRSAQSARSLAELCDFCGELHLRVAVEVLAGRVVGSSGPELLALLELIGRPNVGACMDVNHVFPADRLIPSIYALGRHIFTLHISDHDGLAEKHWLPLQGVIDWRGLADALQESHTPGLSCTRSALTRPISVRQSPLYRGIIARLGG